MSESQARAIRLVEDRWTTLRQTVSVTHLNTGKTEIDIVVEAYAMKARA